MKMMPWWSVLALLLCIVSAVWAGSLHADYSHGAQALALLGIKGQDAAWMANAGIFVLPGLLLAGVALWARGRLPTGARWPARIGWQLMLISALGFALQGVFNLDPQFAPDDGANRLHAATWLLWWVAFAAGGILLGMSRELPTPLRLQAISDGVLVALVSLMGPALIGPAIAQRAAIVLWLLWWCVAAWMVSRASTSMQESSPTAGK